MQRRLESYTENKVVAWARLRRIRCPKLSTPGQNAYPDRIFFLPRGRLVLIEFKREGAKPKKLQQHTIFELQRDGYDAIWSDNAEEAIAYLEKRIGA